MISEEQLGPTDVFTGPMATAITRRVKSMKVITNVTFTSLSFIFTSGEAQAVNPATSITYPALFEFENIKSFRLLTGSAIVVFYSNV
jgi:hypothetical protein